MSVRIMTAVFEYEMPDLQTDDGRTVSDSSCKFVLLALADVANDFGEGAYIGVKRICKKTSLSTQTVCNALNALRHNKYTKLEDEKSKLDTNNYTINIKKLGFYSIESDDSNEQSESSSSSSLFSVYENNIGPITTMVADALKDAEKTYPVQWISDAIRLSVENNKRSWRYCETILKRWKANGKDDGKGKPVTPEPVRPEYQPVPQEDKSQYVPRPANIPRPNIRPAAITGD
jgi:DnaD/phage-associated family protein